MSNLLFPEQLTVWQPAYGTITTNVWLLKTSMPHLTMLALVGTKKAGFIYGGEHEVEVKFGTLTPCCQASHTGSRCARCKRRQANPKATWTGRDEPLKKGDDLTAFVPTIDPLKAYLRATELEAELEEFFQLALNTDEAEWSAAEAEMSRPDRKKGLINLEGALNRRWDDMGNALRERGYPLARIGS